MPTLTTADLQSAATRFLAELRARAGNYLSTAQAKPGRPNNLVLAQMIDGMAVDAAGTLLLRDLCIAHGDYAASEAIERDWTDTGTRLIDMAYTARMASLATAGTQPPVLHASAGNVAATARANPHATVICTTDAAGQPLPGGYAMAPTAALTT